MILPWHYDYNTAKLTLTISDDLSYECHDGGVSGFTKTYQGVTTTLSLTDWELSEKTWISENYGSQFGTWARESDKLTTVSNGDKIQHQDGTDEEGGRIDHLCRPAKVMLGYDMAPILEFNYEVYETPDQGKTIYYRPNIDIKNTNYKTTNILAGEVPQPCGMQPKITGRQLSNYDALYAACNDKTVVDKCKAGEWNPPKFPDLQKLYTYRTQ